MLDLKALRAIAIAATKGPWKEEFRCRYEDSYVHFIGAGPLHRVMLTKDYKSHRDAAMADAKHIAAFDPDTCIKLLDALENSSRHNP